MPLKVDQRVRDARYRTWLGLGWLLALVAFFQSAGGETKIEGYARRSSRTRFSDVGSTPTTSTTIHPSPKDNPNPSSALSCECRGNALRVRRLQHARLGDDRGDQVVRRDVEGVVERLRPLRRDPPAEDIGHLAGLPLLDRD